MVFCQYNYKNYHNGNKDKHPIQPYHWDNWVKMVNDNKRYCKKWNLLKWVEFYFWIYIIKKCSIVELPSFHPYWRLQVNKKIKKEIKSLTAQYEICKKDSNRIKLLFNRNTSLHDIQKKISDLKKRLA